MTSRASRFCTIRSPRRKPLSLFSFQNFIFSLCALCLCGNPFFFLPSPAAAQSLDKPIQTIDEEITAFAYAPDGRIVYSVRRGFKTKEYDLQHDDIWILDTNGKRRRLLQGDKFTRGTQPFSYVVDKLRFSPNSRLILAQLFTTTVLDDTGKTQDAYMTLVLDDSGREVKISRDNVIEDSSNAAFLADNAAIVYLTEAVKPRQLFGLQSARIGAGSTGPIFAGRTFLDVSWQARAGTAVAVERDRNMTGPPRIQLLDLTTQDDTELATLTGFEGGLAISPSGKKAAYFIDKEILEIRDLTAPTHIARIRTGLSLFQWAPDDTRLLLKRAPERKSGDLVWINIPPLSPPPAKGEPPVLQPSLNPLFHGLAMRDFAISPDGRFLAIVQPGRRNLLIFSLPE